MTSAKTLTPYSVFDSWRHLQTWLQNARTPRGRNARREKPYFIGFLAKCVADDRWAEGPGFGSFLYALYAAAPWHFLYLLRSWRTCRRCLRGSLRRGPEKRSTIKRQRDLLTSIPGIGETTAGAILSVRVGTRASENFG